MANKLLKHLGFRLAVLLFMLGYVLIPHEGNYLDAAGWGNQTNTSTLAFDLDAATQSPASSEESTELLHPEMFAVSEYHHTKPVVPISYLPPSLHILLPEIPVKQNFLLSLPTDEFAVSQTLTILHNTVLLI